MAFDKIEWQRQYREKKRLEKEQSKKDEEPVDKKNEDPDLSLDPKAKDEETREPEKSEKKTVKEDIKKPPVNKKKGKKGEKITLNPEAFAKMSVSIERLTLQVHKDKELKQPEEEFISSSAEQLAELYEMPKIVVIVQYVISMLFPHLTRILKAQAEKMEIENESKKIDLEEKKKKVEEGRKQTNPEDVYKSVVNNGDKGN